MMASAASSTPSAASATPPATAIASALEPATSSCPTPGRPPGVASAARVRHLSFMSRSVPLGCLLGHLQLHLDPARLPGVERLVGFERIRERLALGQDAARIDAAALDQLEQLGHVRAAASI